MSKNIVPIAFIILGLCIAIYVTYAQLYIPAKVEIISKCETEAEKLALQDLVEYTKEVLLKEPEMSTERITRLTFMLKNKEYLQEDYAKHYDTCLAEASVIQQMLVIVGL
ncbi:hypothetical protein KJ596_01705 [Patescibacteria group bacterium]|nr:hypothetical protein [Patescibacteria group bacterium]MBU1868383.1 hypothetical protein [Patescibacteria group bacterium]